MRIDFYDANPHRPLEPRMRKLFASAVRVEAAIAFITKTGLLPFRRLLTRTRANSRLVASVGFPTNLDELAEVSRHMPGRVFIHLGVSEPRETKAERIKLHSKIVLIEHEGTNRGL